jgi:uncharacterized protein (TIGR02284 family)
MTTNDDKTVLLLNELMLVARDAERGFQTAADRVKEPELVELFEGISLERAKFVKELEARIRTLRAEPVKLPNPGASLHRAWMEIKSSTDSSPSHALLEECERGEDMALKAYRMALETSDVDVQSREIIQRQYELVQAAHDRIKQLRDSATYAYR